MVAYVKICAIMAVMVGVAVGDCAAPVGTTCPDGLTLVNGQCCGDSLVLGSTTASPAATTKSSTGGTSGSSCVDKTKADGTSDCPSLARLCNDSVYYTLMTEQCPKTCGRCSSSSSTGSTGSCVDLAAPGRQSDCPALSYLCHNSVYVPLMKVQCPKTCGYCSSSGASTTKAASTVAASTTASATAATTSH